MSVWQTKWENKQEVNLTNSCSEYFRQFLEKHPLYKSTTDVEIIRHHTCFSKTFSNIFRTIILEHPQTTAFAIIRSSHWRCSIKKMFLKISQNSLENDCARVFFKEHLRWLLLKNIHLQFQLPVNLPLQ